MHSAKRDNVIKNKLHEYLRSKKISASSDANEDEQEGLTIDEFIELFKGNSLKLAFQKKLGKSD